MKRKTIRGTIMVSMLLVGSLNALSATNLKPVRALTLSSFENEWSTLYSGILNDISSANQTWILLYYGGNPPSPSWRGNLSLWQPPMQQLLQNLADQALLVDYSLTHPPFLTLKYTMFTMDKLLAGTDEAILLMRSASQAALDIYVSFYKGDSGCGTGMALPCSIMQPKVVELALWTQHIQQGVDALALLYSKAKLEMLEVPRLICGPLQVTVGGRISCVGFNVNGTATLVLNNTQNSQTTNLGSQKADSFFDVFFEVTLPNTAGTGHYEMIMTDSGGGRATSFFDVFTTLSTPFEPATIIPLTVLIVAIATLFVASRRTRRPL